MISMDQRLLTFTLGNQNYGISILKVKEIIGMLDITPVPQTPEFIKGVINLRGNIIPVMDLRLKFGMRENEYSERTCIMVVERKLKDTEKLLGVVVDSVSEVVTISAEDIEPSPEYNKFSNDGNFVHGITKIKEKVFIIVDIDKMVIGEEILEMIENI